MNKSWHLKGLSTLLALLWAQWVAAILPDEAPPEQPKAAVKRPGEHRPKPKPIAKSKEPVEKPKEGERVQECLRDQDGREWCREVVPGAAEPEQAEPETAESGRTEVEKGTPKSAQAKEEPGLAKSDRAKADQAPSGSAGSPSLEPEMVRLQSLGISIGKYEVTQGQWRAVMGGNPSHFSSCGDDCPVEGVNWNDTQDYLKRLNWRTGKHYRLPTEDEWFAACQAGGNQEYCGADNIEAVAWYSANADGRTHPVGQKSANVWGLYDLSGNVWEWTSTCWEGDCSKRVVRGGASNGEPDSVRAAYRYQYDLPFRNRNLGFRLVQE